VSRTVYECWIAAGGGTSDYDLEAYIGLLRTHGHLVPKTEGDDGNLPCGWPGTKQADTPGATP
jgi:hypothetical protein